MEYTPNGQPEEKNELADLSSLLPSIRPRTILIGGVVIAVIIVATVAHLLFKKDVPEVITRDTPNGPVIVTNTLDASATNATPPEIVKDKDGREYLTGELILVFRSDVSVENAQESIEREGGTIKQHFANMPVFLVGISESGSEGVNRAILQFRMLPGVERAEPNYLTANSGEGQ